MRIFVNIKDIINIYMTFRVCLRSAYSWVLKNVNIAFCWFSTRACNGAVPDTGGENIISSQIYHFVYGSKKSYTKQYNVAPAWNS